MCWLPGLPSSPRICRHEQWLWESYDRYQGLGVYERCKITDMQITHPSSESRSAILSFSPTSSWLLNSICLIGNSLYPTLLAFLGVSVMVSCLEYFNSPSSQKSFPVASSVLFSMLPHKDPPKTQNLLTISNVLSLTTEQLFPRPSDGLGIYLSGLCYWLAFALKISEPWPPHPWPSHPR